MRRQNGYGSLSFTRRGTADLDNWGGKAKKGSGLARFKSQPENVLTRPERPFFASGACTTCTTCTSISRGSFVTDLVKMQGLRRHNLATSSSQFSLVSLWTFLYNHWSPKDDVKEVFNEDICRNILEYEMVKLCLEQLDTEIPIEAKKRRVEAMVQKMNLTSRSTSLQADMRGTLIFHPGHLDVLRSVHRAGHPLLFVPYRRRGQDLQLFLHLLQKEMPEAKIRPIQCYWESEAELRGLAVRTLPETRWDDLAFSVEHSALHWLLKTEGVNLVMELQGGQGEEQNEEDDRVMTLLHFAELIQMEQLEDIYICPFVCSHDHLQDVKDAEALSRIDFDQPFSLKEYLSSYEKVQQEKNVGGDRNEDSEDLLADLSRHILASAFLQARIASTEILAFTEAFALSDSTKVSSLERFQRVAKDLESRKRDVAFSGKDADVLAHASQVLSPIRRHRPALISHAHLVMSVYALESATASAALALNGPCPFPLTCRPPPALKTKSLRRKRLTALATSLFRFVEPAFPIVLPCRDLECGISDTIDQMLIQELLLDSSAKKVGEAGEHLQERTARRLARQLDIELGSDDDMDDRIAEELLVSISLESSALDQMLLLKSVLFPYVKSFFVTVVEILNHLVGGRQKIRDAFEKMVMQQAGEDFGTKEIISVVIKKLLQLNVLAVEKQSDIQVLSLSSTWDDTEKVTELRSFFHYFL